MCGRFVMKIDQKTLEEIAKQVEQNLADKAEMMSIKMEGEIFPTNIVPIKTSGGLRAMRWGFRAGKRDVINARSETALEKPMFRTAMVERRCLILASGYYEWKKEPDGSKTKYEFSLPDASITYLAGCYRNEEDAPGASFVILTHEPPEKFRAIHDRMPVVLSAQQAEEWLSSDDLDIDGLIARSVTDLTFAPA
ncbi:MAG: SOS response-associated peptidase [Coriobacteriia bacterium]|nr:SOS response-associated peptidase [Coriobacteriia bacterium]